jgi:predicted RecB family endonuclease
MKPEEVHVEAGMVVEIDAEDIARIIAKHLGVDDIVTARRSARAANEIIDYLLARVHTGKATRVEPGHA